MSFHHLPFAFLVPATSHANDTHAPQLVHVPTLHGLEQGTWQSVKVPGLSAGSQRSRGSGMNAVE